jgi:hypothetical protein
VHVAGPDRTIDQLPGAWRVGGRGRHRVQEVDRLGAAVDQEDPGELCAGAPPRKRTQLAASRFRNEALRAPNPDLRSGQTCRSALLT